jgi:hypothetical protein
MAHLVSRAADILIGLLLWLSAWVMGDLDHE